MNFAWSDIINLVALVISIVGSYLMFYFSPVIDSQVYIYTDSEMEKVRKRDARKNKMVRRGMFLLLVGFVLQAAAIFCSVAAKSN